MRARQTDLAAPEKAQGSNAASMPVWRFDDYAEPWGIEKVRALIEARYGDYVAADVLEEATLKYYSDARFKQVRSASDSELSACYGEDEDTSETRSAPGFTRGGIAHVNTDWSTEHYHVSETEVHEFLHAVSHTDRIPESLIYGDKTDPDLWLSETLPHVANEALTQYLAEWVLEDAGRKSVGRQTKYKQGAYPRITELFRKADDKLGLYEEFCQAYFSADMSSLKRTFESSRGKGSLEMFMLTLTAYSYTGDENYLALASTIVKEKNWRKVQIGLGRDRFTFANLSPAITTELDQVKHDLIYERMWAVVCDRIGVSAEKTYKGWRIEEDSGGTWLLPPDSEGNR